MRDKIIIGESDHGKTGMSIPKLIETRMLIQASSGGGKSWLIRRCLEESHGAVQHIIFDIVGEFKTLREQFDYLIVGKNADCKASVGTAHLLARKLLELKVSTICDLSGMKYYQRFLFVKGMIESLLDAPAKIRQPVLVVIDEAHKFCPQAGKAESRAAVIDLMAEGRKYGLCGILATQRISKLAKDACAEAQNRCVGVTTMDLDRTRAGDELGMSKQGRLILRGLKPGQFYCYGPAIDRPADVDAPIVKVGKVRTTHPKVGSLYKLADVVPPTKAMLQVLGKLTDLPGEASRQAKSEADLKKEVIHLRRELATAKRQAPAAPRSDHLAQIAALNKRIRAGDLQLAELLKSTKIVKAHFNRAMNEIKSCEPILDIMAGSAIDDPKAIKPAEINSPGVATRSPAPAIPNLSGPHPGNSNDSLEPRYQALLDALARFASVGINEPSKGAIAALVGNTPGTGAFNNKLGYLRGIGLIDYPLPKRVSLTTDGMAQAVPPESPLTLQAFHQTWFDILKPALTRILKIIMERYPEPMAKDELAIEAGMTPGTGAFNNYLGRLRNTFEVVEYPATGMVKASEILFPEGL